MQRLGRGTTARPPPTHRRGTSTPRPRRGGRPTLERRWMARQATRQSSARRPAATGGPVGTTRRPTATGSCLCSARQDAKTNTDVRPTHWTRRRAGADTSRQRRNKGRRMPGTGDSGPREGRCRKSDTDCTHHSNAHHGRPLAANGRSTFGDTHHQLTCHNPIGRPPAVRGPCSPDDTHHWKEVIVPVCPASSHCGTTTVQKLKHRRTPSVRPARGGGRPRSTTPYVYVIISTGYETHEEGRGCTIDALPHGNRREEITQERRGLTTDARPHDARRREESAPHGRRGTSRATDEYTDRGPWTDQRRRKDGATRPGRTTPTKPPTTTTTATATTTTTGRRTTSDIRATSTRRRTTDDDGGPDTSRSTSEHITRPSKAP